ncbi:MAG: FUSC family protein [Sporichthyaceae bacterium]
MDRDVTGPLPRIRREAADVRRRGEEVLDEITARSVVDVRVRLGRLRTAAPLIAQCAVAAGIAWWIANAVESGPNPPFFAPIAAVISLGSAIGMRLRRTVELVVGVAIGVGVGDLLIELIGSGTASLMLIVALAMSAAVFLDGGQLIVLQASTSSVLVATLVPTDGDLGGLDRFRDALIGGAVGIVIGLVLLPLNPLVVAGRATAPVTRGLANGLDATAAALEAGDVDAAQRALTALRGMDGQVIAMGTAVAASRELARVAPVRWRARDRFAVYADAAPQLDYAVRNGRVLARRASALLRVEQSCPPGLIVAIRALASAARKVGDELINATEHEESRRLLVGAYAEARGVMERDAHITVVVLVAQVRSIAYDLLRATGLDRVQALALLDA